MSGRPFAFLLAVLFLTVSFLFLISAFKDTSKAAMAVECYLAAVGIVFALDIIQGQQRIISVISTEENING